jgi:phosphatidylserine decarboxylase
VQKYRVFDAFAIWPLLPPNRDFDPPKQIFTPFRGKVPWSALWNLKGGIKGGLHPKG